ncbi:uncharacterized protein LOC133057768 isoform X3 [Dama dama]|uniref:uncharacterized protein LOC133057768 isoform X3 n=1 Tax=Dama dama TaxID=30532 RepID=UPI002A36E9D0|nr:uncharacterized protein LOC133057768 isoform X3 [Dama dama]
MSRRSAPLQTPGCPVSLLGQRRGQRSWPSRPGREGSAGRRLPGRFLPLASATGDSNRYHRRTIEPELPAQCFLTCPCDLHTPCHLLFDVTITREGPRADSTTGVRFPELKIKKLHPSDPLPLTVLQSWLLYLPAERAAGRDPPGPAPVWPPAASQSKTNSGPGAGRIPLRNLLSTFYGASSFGSS